MRKLRLIKTLFFLLAFTTLTAQSPLYLQFEYDYSEDGRLKAHLNAANFQQISSFQFTIAFPSDQLVLDTITSSSLEYFPASNYNIQQENGAALVLWFDQNAQSVTLEDGSPLLTIEFGIVEGDAHDLFVTDCPLIIEVIFNAQFDISAYGDVQFNCSSMTGLVTIDENQDCEPDELNGLPNWVIQFVGDNTYTATTSGNGFFNANIPAGTYDVEVFPPNNLWGLCEPVGTIQVAPDSAINLNIAAQALSDCPATYVEITTPFLRRCFEGAYFITYGNEGTITAVDASIQVVIDPDLSVLSSTIPWSSQVDSLYTFNVGDLDPGFQGSFRIDVQVGCEGVEIGQTHCSTAHIYPDTICSALQWSQATIEAEAICTGDSVTLELRNVGVGAMQTMLDVHVIEDDVIVFLGQFQLGEGEIFTKKYPALGSTYRIHAGQEVNHPVSSEVFASVEGCDVDGDGEYSSGFVTQFSTNPDLPYLSVSCEQNVGSYDPNDKNAGNRGVGAANYIEPNTSLDYLIRFQNTGTDTAFNIRILDTLVQELDLSRLRILGSSHPYEFEIKEGNILEFFFPDVLLVDSNANEAASHGYIRYRIAQMSDLSPGTVIENRAAIFFDFNEPVITNIAMHTIQVDFLDNLTGTHPLPNRPKLAIMPNPANDYFIVKLPGREIETKTVELFDSTGKQHFSAAYIADRALINTADLGDGIYFLRVRTTDGKLHFGKVIISHK